MGGKFSRNAPYNEEPSSAVSGGILTKDPHPYPLVYVKGGGGSAPTMRTRKDRK